MGCFCSKYLDEQPGVPPHSSVKKILRPVWKSQKPWTEEELQVCLCEKTQIFVLSMPTS